MSKASILFREAQAFRRWPGRFALAIPPLAMIFITLRQAVWGIPWGNPPASTGGLIFLSCLAGALYVRLVTVRLQTVLREDRLEVGLRGIWKQRRIPRDAIRTAKATVYDAISEFGGYGIRSGRGGKAYIASGNRAVQLVLSDGEKVLIGSQYPDALVEALAERQKGSR